MSGRVQGKVALITGAAQGIGKACAQALAKEGAFVFISDIQDQLGKSVAEEIGPQARYIHQDVQNEKSWETTIQTILKEKGKLNILVNNAGITGFQEGFGLQDPENASLESWRKVHAVNLEGVFLGCKYAIPVMKNKRIDYQYILSFRTCRDSWSGSLCFQQSRSQKSHEKRSLILL